MIDSKISILMMKLENLIDYSVFELRNFFSRWFCSTNHKDIGILYVIFGSFAGTFGTIMSFLIRMELSESGQQIFLGDNDCYNAFVTIHGIVMIFFMVMPIFIGGLGNLLLPLYLWIPDMAFPRLNNLSFWLLVVGSGFIYVSWSLDGGANTGWTFYPPLANKEFSPSVSIDLSIFSLHFAGASSLLGSINFITTIMRGRPKGYRFRWINLFTYAYLITSFLLLFAVPVLAAGLTMLITDRNFGSSFFVVEKGGDSVLYQHIFWFFGHPEVYILIIPSFGVLSHLIHYYCNRPVMGEAVMAYSMIGIGFIGFLVWGHHMYTVGLDSTSKIYFSAMTMTIALPTGLKIWHWIGSLCLGKHDWQPAMLYCIAFVCLFTFGGITGILLANSVLDIVLHDTYFVVAHFHYVLSMGAIFAMFAAFLHWYPVWTGNILNPVLCHIHFWITTLGVNLTFYPMHRLGFAGMPRRIPDFPDAYSSLNAICTIGSIFVAISIILLLYIIIESCYKRIIIINISPKSKSLFIGNYGYVIMSCWHDSLYSLFNAFGMRALKYEQRGYPQIYFLFKKQGVSNIIDLIKKDV